MSIVGGQEGPRGLRIAKEATKSMIIRFYGRVGQALGRQTSIEPPHGVVTVTGLRHLLVERYPWAAEDLLSPTLRACIDDRVVGEDHVVSGNSDVEFFPPLSGG